MIKADIIGRLIYKNGIDKNTATTMVNEVFASITEALLRGERVELRDFMNFRVVTRKEKKGRHLWENREIIIPERKVIKCTVSRNLKEQLKKEQVNDNRTYRNTGW